MTNCREECLEACAKIKDIVDKLVSDPRWVLMGGSAQDFLDKPKELRAVWGRAESACRNATKYRQPGDDLYT